MGTLVLADGGTRRIANPGVMMQSTGSRSVVLAAGPEGERVVSFEQLYETQPAIRAAVDKLLKQIATLPLKTYRRKSDTERERVIDHDANRIVNAPVPRRSGLAFKQWMARPVLIHGNSLIAKFRGNGAGRPPTSLLPLRWPYVSAYAETGQPILWWGTTQLGELKTLDVNESLHFAWEAGNGEIGVSPLATLGVVVANEDAAQRFQSSSLRNGARPSGLVTLPAGTNQADYERVRDSIRMLHEGADQAYKVALATGGADWKPLSWSANEAQLIEQRRVNREEIAMVYDVPPVLLGDLSRATFSNVEELHRMLYVTVLRPWLTFFEETLKAQLIDTEPEWADEGLFYEFDLGEVLRGDKSQEIAAAVQAFTNGLMTLNEVRAVLNLPPVDDPMADKPHIPANNLQPLDGSGGDQPPALQGM